MISTRLSRLGLQFPFMVGPMVGLTHVAFRELITSYLPTRLQALRFTEMLSSRRLPNERLEDVESLKCALGETHLVPQLLGNEERFIGPSIQKLVHHPAASLWGIDINMGCPSSHLLKHNWGVLLMGDRVYAADVVRITKKYSPVPVSVKMRAIENGADCSLDEFTQAIEDAGADWMTLHCRTRAQGHKGEADWELVGRLAQRRGVPVVANGDIQTAEDALRVVQQLGADGAMIGRAATARPWILWQIAAKLGVEEAPRGREGERPPETPEEEGREYFRSVLTFLRLLEQHFGDTSFALKKFHFYVANGQHWFLFGHDFWRCTMKAKSLAQAQTIVLEYAGAHSFEMRRRISFH